jgi:hypothetical protein
MRKEKIYLGSTPADEPCAQVGTPGYEARAQVECNAYVKQLHRFLAITGVNPSTLPKGFDIQVTSADHDLGAYVEVVCIFNDDDERSWDLARLLENEGPTEWDDEARKELGLVVAPITVSLDTVLERLTRLRALFQSEPDATYTTQEVEEMVDTLFTDIEEIKSRL